MERWKIAGRLLRGIDGSRFCLCDVCKTMDQGVRVPAPRSVNDEELGLAQQDYVRK